MTSTRVSIAVSSLIVAALVAGGCGRKAEEPSAAAAPEPRAPAQTAAPLLVPPSADATNVVAEVNGKVLTEGQVARQVGEQLQRMAGQVAPEQASAFEPRLRARIVDDFVVRTLLGDEAEKRQIAITDEDVAKAVAELEERLPPGMTLDDALARQGMSREKLDADIRPELRIQKMIEQELAGVTNLTESEIASFYETEKEGLSVPENVQARHILIAVNEKDDEAAKKEKKAKADGLREKLVAGADFAELAKANSDCPSKENGGDLGSFRRGQMVPAFEEAAFTQATNAIGPVIETQFGYHIVQVLERTSERTLSLEESRETIQRFLGRKKEQEAMKTFMEKLESQGNVKRYDRSADDLVEPAGEAPL